MIGKKSRENLYGEKKIESFDDLVHEGRQRVSRMANWHQLAHGECCWIHCKDLDPIISSLGSAKSQLRRQGKLMKTAARLHKALKRVLASACSERTHWRKLWVSRNSVMRKFSSLLPALFFIQSRNLVTLMSLSWRNWIMFMRWPFWSCCVTLASYWRNLVTEISFPFSSWGRSSGWFWR